MSQASVLAPGVACGPWHSWFVDPSPACLIFMSPLLCMALSFLSFRRTLSIDLRSHLKSTMIVF